MKPELVCYIPPGEPVPPDALVVDYDLIRLASCGARRRECKELGQVEGKFACILINALSHQSTDQLKWDFTSAARLLTSDGLIRVRVHNARALRHIERLLKPHFHKTTLAETERRQNQKIPI